MKKTAAENKDGAKIGDILAENHDTEHENTFTFFQVIALRGTTQIVIKELRYNIIAFDEYQVQIIPIPDSMEPDIAEEIRRTEKTENGYIAKYGNNCAFLYHIGHTYFNSYHRNPFLDTKQWDCILKEFPFDLVKGTGFFSPDGKTNIFSPGLLIEVRYPDSSIQKLTIQGLLNGDISLEDTKKIQWCYPDWTDWVISHDISCDLHNRKNLTWKNTINCILSAPHRNIFEKFEAIKNFNPYFIEDGEKERFLSDMDTLITRMSSGNVTFQYYYEAEIREYGIRCPSQNKILFSDARSAIFYITDQIREISGMDEGSCNEINSRYGVLYEYQLKSNKRFVNEWDLIVSPYGEIIYCLPAPHKKGASPEKWVGMIDSSYIRIPYPSGTIITMSENPFFGPLKGVLLNKIEPGEKGSIQKGSGQGLIYLEHTQPDHPPKFKYIQLEDDRFLSKHFGSDFPLPFRQFLERYEGKLTTQESPLEDISRLIIKDKQEFYTKNTEIIKRGTDIERHPHN